MMRRPESRTEGQTSAQYFVQATTTVEQTKAVESDGSAGLKRDYARGKHR